MNNENQKQSLTIGTLAKSAQVGVETVRFYERKGIIEQPKKTASFRIYAESDIMRIRFVKKMQDLGFSLEEIKSFLFLGECSSKTTSEIKKLTNKKIEEIKSKIEDLQSVLQTLEKFESTCGNQNKENSECKITECFENNWDCCGPK